MTFTVVARCRESGQAGLALATVSIAAGGLCPFFTQRGDIAVCQAYASPRIGYRMASGMERGESPDAVFAAARAMDAHPHYRQLILLSRSGETLAYSGSDCRPWAGHIIEDDVVVAGNVLAGRQVIEAMLQVFKASAGESLSERLLLALEAGRDAGGQATADGLGLSERSAMVRVLGSGEAAGWPVLDLRVDLHNSAIHELRRLYQVHGVYAGYSDRRENDPPNAGSIVGYEAEAIKRGGVFSGRPSVYR
ncbi:DUF1028 domain-containing protein [Ferrovibrio terrae]|uniref:DUF1028 domain-containing protein n=1 Tax=Ferrovibrio terrae TaxID=2594003 RepID=UPI0031380CE8